MSRKDNKNRVLQKGESQRKDGTYMYRYQDNYGKRKYIYNSNLSKLREEEKRIIRDLEDGINTSAGERTLNEQFYIYISSKTNLSNSTMNKYLDLWKNHVKGNEIGSKKISNIKRTDILNFYNYLKNYGLAYSTIKIFHGMISASLEFAVGDDILRKNPCNDCLKYISARKIKEKEALSREEQQFILDYIKWHKDYFIYHPMINFMLETGLRCGETIGLTWNDVNLKDRTININHQLIYKKKDGKFQFYADTTKTESGLREIPITSSALNSLLEQRKLQLENGTRTNISIDGFSDFVFSSKNKRPVMPASLNHILGAIVNSINKEFDEERFPHISAHNLRHTACTRMAEDGMDIKVLQKIMGHSSISVTMNIYNHSGIERSREEIRKIEKNRSIG